MENNLPVWSKARVGLPRRNPLALLALAGAFLIAAPAPAEAYIGPGAGFVFVTSFLVLFISGVLAFLSFLAWPVRALWRLLRRVGRPKPRIRRLIVVGYDGQEPKLTDRFMAEGKLPNFQALAEEGCYHRLATTFPSVSPSRGLRSAPERIRRSTTSSISSIETAVLTCPCSLRPGSAGPDGC